jgi:hypothetical protein
MAPLGLPTPDAVARMARPKERLKEVLELASEATGRRLERVRLDFPLHRRALLQDLPTMGPLERVPSWQQLRSNLQSTLGRVVGGP